MPLGVSPPWSINFRMGGYDCDSLFSYMCGTLGLPFFARRS